MSDEVRTWCACFQTYQPNHESCAANGCERPDLTNALAHRLGYVHEDEAGDW